MQPTIDLTCTYFEGHTQPSETCKLLNVRDSYRLKRLASAVQLRPWPPYSKGFRSHSNFPYYRQFTGSYWSCPTRALPISSVLLWLNRSSRNIPWAFSLSAGTDLA